MIVALDGIVDYKSDNFIHINVNNITYEVFVSKNSMTNIELSKSLKINIIHIIKEDSQTLYGFMDKNEKTIFQRVIKINGIGAKIALEICSHFSPKSFYEMIQTSNIDALKKVSGIGAKSAGKILIELNGFNIDLIEDNQSNTPYYSDALNALLNLGFSKEQIQKVLSSCKDVSDVQDLIKQALKKLSKK
jgi:Holliday junction DNA helicase RuvA